MALIDGVHQRVWLCSPAATAAGRSPARYAVQERPRSAIISPSELPESRAASTASSLKPTASATRPRAASVAARAVSRGTRGVAGAAQPGDLDAACEHGVGFLETLERATERAEGDEQDRVDLAQLRVREAGAVRRRPAPARLAPRRSGRGGARCRPRPRARTRWSAASPSSVRRAERHRGLVTHPLGVAVVDVRRGELDLEPGRRRRYPPGCRPARCERARERRHDDP